MHAKKLWAKTVSDPNDYVVFTQLLSKHSVFWHCKDVAEIQRVSPLAKQTITRVLELPFGETSLS